MPPKLTPKLREVLALFAEGGTLTNAIIAERLGLKYDTVYYRTRRLRDLGLLHSCPNWVTCCDGNGSFPWRDENGNPRTWLELFPAQSDEPDIVLSILDPTKNQNGKGD